jgi:hypothetical protein
MQSEKDGILSFAVRNGAFEDIVLSEVSQVQKDK